MSALRYNAVIEQGATYSLLVTWEEEDGTPIDLTGYSARMQVREELTASETLLNLSSPDDIALGDDGTLEVLISAEVTAALSWRSAVYDLEVEASDGTVTRLLQGPIRVSAEVTR